jgi:hypothetical protein
MLKWIVQQAKKAEDILKERIHELETKLREIDEILSEEEGKK